MSLLARIFVGAVVVVSVGACAFKKDDDKVTQDDVKELMRDVAKREQHDEDALVATHEITVRAVPQKLPSHYRLEVIWPERLKHVQVLLNGVPETPTMKNKVIAEVFSGESYEVEILSLSSLGRLVSNPKLTVSIPQDLVVTSMSLNADWVTPQLGRLFFDEGAEVILNGFNVRIQANEIIANNAMIKTVKWWDGEKTRRKKHPVRDLKMNSGVSSLVSGVPLLRVPQVHISTARFRGDLKFWMFGIHGAHGRNWDQLLSESDPIQGSQGSVGMDGIVVNQKPPPCHGVCGSLATMALSRCGRHPSAGGPGGKGPTYNGEDGENGGSTGNVTLLVSEELEGLVTVYTRPGKAGLGGAGSPALAGGLGGEPGSCPKLCNCATRGPAGPSGDPGTNGKNGEDGVVGSILFLNGESNKNPNFRIFDATGM